ncbi:unnamed protein product [Phytophthora lilii]|uniref:Unnamed protein product n=1 Tax=Phytophthora lilii TaxID=2077276 RepID=A0A9W6WQN8_9STRA|nr:unnamed protein product [Phytophthora lilii]
MEVLLLDTTEKEGEDNILYHYVHASHDVGCFSTSSPNSKINTTRWLDLRGVLAAAVGATTSLCGEPLQCARFGDGGTNDCGGIVGFVNIYEVLYALVFCADIPEAIVQLQLAFLVERNLQLEDSDGAATWAKHFADVVNQHCAESIASFCDDNLERYLKRTQELRQQRTEEVLARFWDRLHRDAMQMTHDRPFLWYSVALDRLRGVIIGDQLSPSQQTEQQNESQQHAHGAILALFVRYLVASQQSTRCMHDTIPETSPELPSGIPPVKLDVDDPNALFLREKSTSEAGADISTGDAHIFPQLDGTCEEYNKKGRALRQTAERVMVWSQPFWIITTFYETLEVFSISDDALPLGLLEHEMKRLCAFGGAELEEPANDSVDDLKDAIKAKKMFQFPADELHLFLAKKDGAWLPDNEGLDTLLQSEIDTSSYLNMRASWKLTDDVYKRIQFVWGHYGMKSIKVLLVGRSLKYIAMCYCQLTTDTASADRIKNKLGHIDGNIFRINNKLGHIDGNILISCVKCTTARKDMSPKGFRYKKMLEFNSDRLVYSIDKEEKDIYTKMKANIAGGPSIIFNRYAKRNETKIRGGKLCKKVIGYDASALYLWALEHLKQYFGEMTPIFKNTLIDCTDESIIGKHMYDYNQAREKSRSKPARKLIGSYFEEKILIYAPLLKWYLSHGMEITKTYSFIKASSHKAFAPFMEAVSNARRERDADESKAMIAEMMKLVGNSAFGRSGMDMSKHKEIKYRSSDKAIKAKIEHFTFHGLEELNDACELTMMKRKLKNKNTIHLSIAIYQLAKLRMLQFYYDCIDVYFDRSDFQYQKMDTDSAYIAFSCDNPFQDCIKPELREHFVQHKYDWFPRDYSTDVAKFDRRTPGLFKDE